KYGDELALVFSPDETVKLGDTILIDDILAQVVDIQFADLPGVLEHILRKSLIARSESEEHVQPELQSIVDSLADQKLARTKIRGRLVSDETNGKTHTSFKTGLSEFNVSRVHSAIQVLPQDALFDSLNLTFPPTCDLGATLSSDCTNFDILVDRLGINLITGMKGSGKSYLAKRLLFKLMDHKVLTLVFDLNAEYLHLWKKDEDTPNDYAERMITFTPYLEEENDFGRRLTIPLHEITYDDFASFSNIQRDSPTYLYLIQFWRRNAGTAFTLDDLERFVKGINQEHVREGLLMRVEVARTSGLFGTNMITGFIKALQNTGGAIIFNLSEVSYWERKIAVEFVLRRLVRMGQAKEFEAVSLFLEEAQLYVDPQNMIDIITRMRHSGVFPTFITNTPRTLPDDVFTLLDNLIAFSFRNEDELHQLAHSGLIDQKSINALRHLEKRQCIAVGNITSHYPLFIEIQPQTGALMGGETRKLSPS
ncbi:MAG: ATP-binding protein, partial [Halobacteriota archaeon]